MTRTKETIIDKKAQILSLGGSGTDNTQMQTSGDSGDTIHWTRNLTFPFPCQVIAHFIVLPSLLEIHGAHIPEPGEPCPDGPWCQGNHIRA